MKTLYRRLNKIGFTKAYVMDNFLPDWWEDSLAENPASLSVAEASISRMLSIPISDLHNADLELVIPKLADNVVFKKHKNINNDSMMPSVLIARQTVKAVLPYLNNLNAFSNSQTAQEVRAEILTSNDFVCLESLLKFAWSNGIVVLHMNNLPKGKFKGLATYENGTPVVVLTEGKKAPAWLAFHLAHEIGHIMLRHITEENNLLVDADITGAESEDAIERQADEFAIELLTGQKQYGFKHEFLNGEKLAECAKDYGNENKIDYGSVALIYGYSTDRIGVAQNALKALKLNTGAHELVAGNFENHLSDTYPEIVERFLGLVTET